MAGDATGAALARLDTLARTSARRLALVPPGVAGALLLAAVSLTPSLLPRPPLFQGIVTGVAAAAGYGLGVLCSWCWSAVRDRPRRAWPRWATTALAVVGAVGGIVMLLLGARWQREAHRLAGSEPTPVASVLLVPVIAVLVAGLVLVAARGLRALTRRLVRLLQRRIGPKAAQALGVLVVVGLGVTLVSGVLADAGLRALDASFAVGDLTTPSSARRPESALRSGSAESLVGWDDLGREGRVFVAGGPTAEQIEDVVGTAAMDPIRAFAGLGNADDAEERAELAVDDLERAGGFDREHLLVVTTTGTGWVEPSAAAGFEYVTGGDSAIVAMQYSHLPSWLSFVVDAQRAREAGRGLFDAVYQRWTALPPDDRPRLYVFGESLGSFGAEEAFSGEFDLANRTTGALFVGPPSFNRLWGELSADRDPGSPQIEPVYRDGRVVRFATRAESPPPADRPWEGSRVLYLQHASDPVTWWSPDLLLRRPDWLEDERGADVPGGMRWVPLVTFFQVSGDLAMAFDTEPGHGHNFSGEHAAAWVQLVRPDGWTEDTTEELRRLLRR
ncbi:alpha/beta-hydrolase family protein [Nocardioides sp. zg-1228]|uniref:alpha/beta hydrolase n=1 Tax=Nocardioides sp. zg-1228 TaxID=2763008 RepID=UPI0016424B31|nr:alpha/beta-hydrolase family protein [Nocardioides sp. zg-1228]MBC2934625.1 alpha/beta-hydrolase family protein [Nocardioides sp. zg-1228]QSF59372.1 alpha/beta-hydrolase family protein [Nocardioides sp. zg-1228]